MQNAEVRRQTLTASRGQLRLGFWLLAFAFCILHSAFSADPDWHALVTSGQLVEINKVDPTILVELRYATTHNCVGEAIYPEGMPCLLRPEIALRLKAAQQYLRGWNYGLKVWDAYRTPEAQHALWKRWAKRGYVADPDDGRGSLHTWGLAVDVTMVDRFGNDVEMPSDFDVFTADASGIYRGKNDAVRHNLHLLHRAMFGSGFQGLTTEWWHFTARGWDKFDRLTADPPANTATPAVPAK
ncbi:MAG: M15 family metallopeptidase [Gluconacetobacter diazotrophicus]|nr:M15 family metallopeptidase [Gluconacetobacter diazotrophicus]